MYCTFRARHISSVVLLCHDKEKPQRPGIRHRCVQTGLLSLQGPLPHLQLNESHRASIRPQWASTGPNVETFYGRDVYRDKPRQEKSRLLGDLPAPEWNLMPDDLQNKR